MGDSRRDIPVLDDHANYETWKKEVQVWVISTNLEKSKQAAKLIINMKGKPRDVAVNMGIEEIQGDDCMAKLFAALDKLYVKDTTQSLFKAIDSFESYRRPSHVGIDDYILEFQRLYKNLIQLQGNKELYSDVILAYRLLNQASLDEEQQRLVRATCTKGLSYDTMEEQLRRTFGDSLTSGSTARKDNTIQFKEEPQVFYQECENEDDPGEDTSDVIYLNGASYRKETNHQKNNNHFSSQNRFQPYQSRNNNPPQKWQKFDQQKTWNQRQPQTSGGYTSPGYSNGGNGNYKSQKKKTCFVCDKEGHLKRDCPYRPNQSNSNNDTENNRISFFKSDFELPDSKEEMCFLVGETINKALLDTGASSTVCGQQWLKVFEESLSEEERKKITVEDCNRSFRFGDGDKVISAVQKTIPVTICGEQTDIKVNIVENDIPLLLSRETMKKMGMKIDVENDQVEAFGRTDDIIMTTTGHMVIKIGQNNEDHLKTMVKKGAIYIVNSDDPEK